MVVGIRVLMKSKSHKLYMFQEFKQLSFNFLRVSLWLSADANKMSISNRKAVLDVQLFSLLD